MEKKKLSKKNKELILEQLSILTTKVFKHVYLANWPSQNQKLYNGLVDLNKSIKAFEIKTEADPLDICIELKSKIERAETYEEKVPFIEQLFKLSDDHNLTFDKESYNSIYKKDSPNE